MSGTVLRKAWKHIRGAKRRLDKDDDRGFIRPVLAVLLNIEQRLVRLEKMLNAKHTYLVSSEDEAVELIFKQPWKK